MKRILIISAHPDDEVIGAGGTLLRHSTLGDEIFWCIVTQAYSPLWPDSLVAQKGEEIELVQAELGIQQVFRLGFPSVKLNTVPHVELTSALQKVIDTIQPAVVYVPPENDINLDHHLVFHAALVATRPLPGNSVRRLISYEISPTTAFGTFTFTPNIYVDITDYLERKLEIMALYASELREYPHPRSIKGLRLFAQERGARVGVQAAECFRLIRELDI